MDDSALKDIDDLDRMFNEEIAIQSSETAKNDEKKKRNSNQKTKKEKSIDQNNKKQEKQEKENKKPTSSEQKQKKPRKPNMKVHLPDLQLNDLPPISMPILTKSTSASSIGQQYSEPTSPTQIGKIESQINNYLDNRLKELKNEFCSNLNNLLDKRVDYDHIINKFTKNLMSDVEREIKFDYMATSLPTIPFNVGIDLQKRRTNFDSLSDMITEFKARNATVSESLQSYHHDLRKEIHQRNKVYKTNKKQKDDLNTQLRHAKKKGYRCEMMLSMLAAEIECVKKKSEDVVKKTNDLDNQNSAKAMEYISTRDFIRELNSFLPDLSQSVSDPISFDGYNSIFNEEIQDIHKRRISINNTLQEMCSVLIDKYEKKQLETREFMRTTMSYLPTEDIMLSMTNRLSLMDPNKTLLRAPKKRAIKNERENNMNMTMNPSFFNHDKFTLPLSTYLY